MKSSEPATPATILVVDDDEDTREFIVLLLRTDNFQTLEANCGSAALAVAKAQPVQAIVLDLRLPDLDGFAVCRHLRANSYADVPIILVTADAWPDLDRRAQAAGVTTLVRKPFAPGVLVERLMSLLSATI